MLLRIVTLVFFAVCWSPTALAQGRDLISEAKDSVMEEVDPSDAETEARIAAAEKELAKKKARVLVLPWPEADVTERNLMLKTLVQARIGRPSAKFYPAMDLYQEGRRQKGRDGIPEAPIDKQTGHIDREVLPAFLQSYSVDRLPDSNSIPPEEAYPMAQQLQKQLYRLFYVEDDETREALFNLYVHIGHRVQGKDERVVPFYRVVGGQSVNYYLYLAAVLVWEESQAGGEPRLAPLVETINDSITRRIVQGLIRDLDEGDFPLIPLSFQDSGRFDLKAFAKDYKVVINGIERQMTPDGILMLPRGRIYVHLERTDGYGLSDLIEVQALDDKVYFVQETARQRMGYGLLRELMNYPDECSPGLSHDSQLSLALYAALHPQDEFYVVVARNGSLQDIYIWRYDPIRRKLNLHVDPNRGFPVRFAVLGNTGMSFSGGTLGDPPSVDPKAAIGGGAAFTPPTPEFEPSGIPLDFQLRLHFHRLMVGMGVQLMPSITGDPWADKYQTDLAKNEGEDNEQYRELVNLTTGELILRERTFQRLVYGQIGGFPLRDAPYGLGPYGFMRVGWTHAPHALNVTGHIGITESPGKNKRKDDGVPGRFAPILDAGVYGGVGIPFGDSVYNSGSGVSVIPDFGIRGGAGFTF